MTHDTLHFITMNIEGHHHLETVAALITQQQPDIVCVQEAFGVDIVPLAKSLGYTAYFEPMVRFDEPNRYRIDPLGEWGVAFLVAPHMQLVEYLAVPYVQHTASDNEPIPSFVDGDPNSVNRVVQIARVAHQSDSAFFTFANTHFTWTPKGEPTPEQFNDLAALLNVLQSQAPAEHVLCGDFNAPRGGEVFAQLAQRYRDNIPAEFTTTLDETLHYAGKLELVVDGIFSTPQYVVKNVRQYHGISDHTPISAHVSTI